MELINELKNIINEHFYNSKKLYVVEVTGSECMYFENFKSLKVPVKYIELFERKDMFNYAYKHYSEDSYTVEFNNYDIEISSYLYIIDNKEIYNNFIEFKKTIDMSIINNIFIEVTGYDISNIDKLTGSNIMKIVDLIIEKYNYTFDELHNRRFHKDVYDIFIKLETMFKSYCEEVLSEKNIIFLEDEIKYLTGITYFYEIRELSEYKLFNE